MGRGARKALIDQNAQDIAVLIGTRDKRGSVKQKDFIWRGRPPEFPIWSPWGVPPQCHFAQIVPCGEPPKAITRKLESVKDLAPGPHAEAGSACDSRFARRQRLAVSRWR